MAHIRCGASMMDQPGDAEIRRALRLHLAEQWADSEETLFIEELGLCRGRVRVDLAAVNGVVHGYEIKSSRDRLSRLPRQVELYTRVLDRASVVIDPGHLGPALDLIRPWWGVLVAEVRCGRLHLENIRPATENPGQDPRALVELLWRDEALCLLETREVAQGVRTKPRSAIWDRVCEHYDCDEIARVVRERLKLRARTATAERPS